MDSPVERVGIIDEQIHRTNTLDGGFVPECIRRPEIGLDLEIFNANAAADIQERMATFNELHFYDGTLSTKLTLEEAHVKIGFMLKVRLHSDFFLQFG